MTPDVKSHVLPLSNGTCGPTLMELSADVITNKLSIVFVAENFIPFSSNGCCCPGLRASSDFFISGPCFSLDGAGLSVGAFGCSNIQ